MLNIFKEIKTYYKQDKNKKSTLILYILLRFLVIVSLVLQLIHGNWSNVFLCILTLILFTIPYFIDKKLHISLPNTLKDLMVNFVGAVIFSFIGLLYIKNRDEYKFAEMFIPVIKKESNQNQHI